MKNKNQDYTSELIFTYKDKIKTSLEFDDLITIQTAGEDEDFLKKDHFIRYNKILKSGEYEIEKIIPFYAQSPSLRYEFYHKAFFKTESHLDYDLIQDLEEQYLIFKMKLSERKIRWVYSKNFDVKIERLSKNLNLSDKEIAELRRAFFNYYISFNFEKYYKKLKLPHLLINELKERIFQVKHLVEKINFIIDENSYNEKLTFVNYAQIDTALKRARSLIRKELIGYDNKKNAYHLDDLEKEALILKNQYYSLCFKRGPGENISANNLILNLYKIFIANNSIYLPKVEKTIEWLNSNFDLGNDFKIQKFNSHTLRKRINDLKKREDNTSEEYLLKKATLFRYLYLNEE